MAALREKYGEDYEQPTAVPMLTDGYNLPAKKVVHKLTRCFGSCCMIFCFAVRVSRTIREQSLKKQQQFEQKIGNCEVKNMEHCGTQRIETDRLVLRRFSMDDADSMYKNWASDSEVTKYLTWPAHTGVEVSKAILGEWVLSYSHENYYQWAIVLKAYGSDPIGSIGVVNMNDDVSMVHIGYCLGRPWWHQGIMSEALKAVMDFFFEIVGVNRIESRHDPRNPHSGMVMKKCRMKYEGTLRSSDRNNQGICDACWYALLKSER